MKKVFKVPPFTLDRSLSGTLVDQLECALQKAIETGYYIPGDIIPPTRELSEILGVSRVVAIRAIRRLASKRIVNPRPHAGSVVCEKARPLWKGQVLIVVPPGVGNHADNAVYAVLRDTLTASGYLPLVATVPRSASGKFDDFALLETMLRQQVDVVVQLHDQPNISAWLSKRKVPFVGFSSRDINLPNCIGTIVRRFGSNVDEFAEHCREAGVSTVMQIKVWRSLADVVPAMKRVGIRVKTWKPDLPEDDCTAYGLKKWALEAFGARFAKEGRSWLPEFIFFQDDHLTEGAMLAFEAAGIRIPDDVRIVTWANRDYGPVSHRPLTRIEIDNVAFGRKMAYSVLHYLQHGEFREQDIDCVSYIRGESF